MKKKFLMVCLGNICRSPLAEGILQHQIDHQTLDWEVDSAGTSAFHAGDLPDERSISTGLKYGIDIRHQRSRPFRINDFDRFDHILVMDASNYQNVIRLARNQADKDKVEMIMNYLTPGYNQQVPDPYYGDHGFENVYQMLLEATNALIEKLK